MTDIDTTPAVNKINERVEELTEAGLSTSIALGLTVVELSPSEPVQEAVADEYDIEVGTLRSYKSKARNRDATIIRKFLSSIGGYRSVLAMHKSRYRDEWTVLITGVSDAPEGLRPYYPDSSIRVVTVRAGGPSGEPTLNIRIRTKNSYSSLEELAQAKLYESESQDSEELWKWRDLLVDAGMDDDELPMPGELLDASHPDSTDHDRYINERREFTSKHRNPNE